MPWSSRIFSNQRNMFGSKAKNNTTVSGSRSDEGVFGTLRQGLRRTREGFWGGLRRFISLGRPVDAAVLEALEDSLLIADVGVEATRALLAGLSNRQKLETLTDADALYAALREEMITLLTPVCQPLQIPLDRNRPFAILLVGVNGAGKTTTAGKLALRFHSEGQRVILAAADTFRAAAVEQLITWGERIHVPVISQTTGADAASVAFDALSAASARNAQVLIVDTAGRLHTRNNLMEELKKIRRVMGKVDPDAPHEVLIVLDATTGQNALAQARQFHEAVGLSGITVTKLDGTAKGGIVLAIARELGIPLRFIGVGEKPEDLRPFDATAFVDALLGSTAQATE